ncbi:MAG: N-acetylglucosamine-6-phosphate deacetylase [Lachnospiraceae bacterium]|nr:N-acetylglucosamine-6-phosphate deacetylase [Lachnospiraceae bacterium]
MKITGASVFTQDGSFSQKDLYIKEGLFADGPTEGEEAVDAAGCYAIPGLIDIHFHGAVGEDVCDGNARAFEKIAAYEVSRGITAICPATLTLPVEELKQVLSLGAAFAARGDDGLSDLVGFNMEGPFISPVKRGAQNAEFIRKCDPGIVEAFYEASGGLLKIIGLAPEENPDFESYIAAVKDRVIVSLAHTASDYDTARKAFDAGACHAVHLYNAMTGMSHREPGVVGAVFDSGHVTAELICDGIHIHPAAVRATFQMMGPRRMILISDSMRSTGMPDGEYDLGGLPAVKKGREVRLKDGGAIAGSASDLMDCLRTAVLEMGIPLETAVAAATVNPARRIGIYDRYGSLEPGKLADVVLLSKKDLSLVRVYRKGSPVG